MSSANIGVSPSQLRAARALLAWNQQELARRAGIAASTVADFERGRRVPVANNLDAMRAALEAGGISFLPGGAVNGPLPAPKPIALLPDGRPLRLISSMDLAQWAERQDSKGAFPTLIQRLILSTTRNNFTRLRFPAEESIQAAGWDGMVEQNAVLNLHVLPTGRSGWELTTQRLGIRDKANSDYQKRTDDSRELASAESTFVFSTLRSWPDGEKWAQEKKNEGRWADVRVVDADELVVWIELNPPVAYWLASQIGKLPAGVQPLEDFWHEWRLGANIPVDQDLVMAGRDDEFIETIKWLQGEPAMRSIQADSPGEAIAFLYASIDALPEPHRQYFLARSIRALDQEAARRLGECTSPMVIVMEHSEPGLAARLVQKGHHVFVAYGSSVGAPETVTTLSRSSHDAFQEALQKLGVDESKSLSLTRDSVRSVTVLRRLIPSDAPTEPTWAQGHDARVLVAALLAGGWDSNRPGDHLILEQLSGVSFDEFETQCASLTGFPDAPLRHVGTTWKIASPRDAWFRLSRLISRPDLERFAAVAKIVLGAADPRFELDPDERWLAGIRGHIPEHSPWLHGGLTETLLLLAMFGRRLQSVKDAEKFADAIVHSLLMDADARRWYSLSRELLMLAEAAPVTFLDSVDKSLRKLEAPVATLFQEDGGPIFGGANHSHLLWALEMLAWSPTYLLRACEILARLAPIGLKTTWANRPHSSLRAIFLLWMPQTNATLDERLRVLDYLRREQPEAAWELMLGTLPAGHDFVTPTPKPRWRDFSVPTPQTVTYALIAVGAREVSNRLLDDMGADPNRCATLIAAFPNLDPAARNRLPSLLSEKAASFGDDASRLIVWNAIRKLLDHHRSFPQADWSLPENELRGIENVYALFQPADPISQRAFLFSDAVFLTTGRQIDDWEARETEIRSLREKAIAEILEIEGNSGIVRLARTAENSFYVGMAYAEHVSNIDDADALLEDLLNMDDDAVRRCRAGLIAKMDGRFGPTWGERLLKKAESDLWPEDKVLQVLLALPCEDRTWQLAASFGDSVRGAYWKRANCFWLPTEEPQLSYGIDQLLSANRARTVVHILAGAKQKVKDQTIADVLLHAASEPWPDGKDHNDAVMFQWSVSQLLGRLDQSEEVSAAQIAQLEWLYLALLDDRLTRPPLVLHRAMSNEPTFFVQVLSAAFRPRSETAEKVEPEPRVKAMAMQAYRLLESWKTVPGELNSTIDSTALNNWVDEAHQRAVLAERGAIGDQYIGRILSFTKPAEDGIWPQRAVREVIERMKNEDIELGIRIALHNQRGVTSRGMLDGGALERGIAANYKKWADELRFEWPQTASLLDRIAASFEDTARHFDENAEHTDWSY